LVRLKLILNVKGGAKRRLSRDISALRRSSKLKQYL